MKLSRTITYALRATTQLAGVDKKIPIPCSKLASEGNMPERFLLQILRSLVTHGILRSTRGVDGGYSLVRPANEVSVLDVISAIDGPLETEVSLVDGLSEESQTRLSRAFEQINATARDQLNSIKLSQLVGPP